MKTNILKVIILIVFCIYVFLWLYLNSKYEEGNVYFDYYTDSYGLIAGLGGLTGFFVAKKWGGFKSIIGKSLTLFSLGLFFQFLGQLSYAYYYYIFNIENPYPSFGEIFYFGSIIIYIYAIYLMAKAAGSFYELKGFRKAIVILVPIITVGYSYFRFLSGYEFDWSYPLLIFLDFGYPLGQAIYISLAIVAYFLSRQYLGGKMKYKILLVLIALVIQYLADFTFLTHTFNEIWRPGGIDDLLFLSAYFVMSMAILGFNDALNKLKSLD